MNWKQVKRQWPAVQNGIKRTWGKIDEMDLKMIHGERESFIRILAQRYHYTEAVAETKVDHFVACLQLSSESHAWPSWVSQRLQRCWDHVHFTSRR
ncbi:hypothetical protein [Rhodopirellula sp. P2]|uniref:hypothetical protein n=1 Tax=Rhodopirellula sp. P2 TaxID=2127060 RepID=UPI002367D22A|nr:hypothetical protein [Rhodopirellula sp. P2]WDQ16768.1 hypothetical protein PSR62_24595 [Rhodopirellula sp. P2]